MAANGLHQKPIKKSAEHGRRFSGRYEQIQAHRTSGGNKPGLVLHVDVDGTQALGVVSGDVPSGGRSAVSLHFIGRVKRRKKIPNGLLLWVDEVMLRFAGNMSRAYELKLRIWRPVGSDQIQGTAWFTHGEVKVGPFHIMRTAPWFRQIEIEVDREQGARKVEPYLTNTHPDRPANLPLRALTLESVFAEAGVDIVRSPHSDVISSREAGKDQKWSETELHDAMTVHWDAFANEPQWKIWVFMAKRSERPRLGGIVINANLDEPSGLNRQGVALFTKCDYFFSPKGSFCKHNPPSDEAAKRELFFTLVHEAGHTFNLTHPWERIPGRHWGAPEWSRTQRRTDSLTFMNLPNLATPGGSGANATWFYRRFRYQFDPSELLFMRHAADRYVEMGGETWDASHARVAHEDVESGLELRVRSRKSAYEMGEPVLLELRLRNLSEHSILVHKNLDPSDRFVRIAITDPTGRRRVFLPLEETYQAVELTRLNSRKALYGEVDLTIGRGGFPFKRPGSYLIEVTYTTLEGTEVSAALRFCVRSPSARDAGAVRELFDARVGRVLYFDGTRVLGDVIERLNWIRVRLGPLHPASIHIASTLFQGIVRPGRVFDIQSASERLIPHQPDRAVALVTDLLVDQAGAAADTMGHIHFRRLIDRYTTAALQAGKHQLAVTAQRRLLALFEQRSVLPRVVGEVKSRLAEIDALRPKRKARSATA